MNYREKESFIKSFALFFVALLTMGTIALGLYHMEQKQFYQLRLLTEMDGFSYVLQGEEFTYAIISRESHHPMHKLIVSDREVYALFPWVKDPDHKSVKVSYPHEQYVSYMQTESRKMWILFAALGGVSALISMLFARYSLTPMRRSLMMMEDFLKDLIHDLNTPVSSILLNAQLLKRKYGDEEIERITLGTQTIHALSKNLEALYRDFPLDQEKIKIGEFLAQRVRYFESLHPELSWSISGVGEACVSINREVLIRVVDNLLSNAGKYNRSNGSVSVQYDECTAIIADTGIGIREPKKVFERFYHESDRGLGIGLHIVKTLSEKTGIKVTLSSEVGVGTKVELRFF